MYLSKAKAISASVCILPRTGIEAKEEIIIRLRLCLSSASIKSCKEVISITLRCCLLLSHTRYTIKSRSLLYLFLHKLGSRELLLLWTLNLLHTI